MNQIIATFYKFVPLSDFVQKRQSLLDFCQARGIKGTILLASEGINGAIVGTRQEINAVLAFLRSDPLLADLEHKEAITQFSPFKRMKVKLKKEIVTLGLPEIDPNQQVGNYVEPQKWNELITDSEVIVLDTRNQYEVDIGTFKGAIAPKTRSFREFPDYVINNLNPQQHKKVAMFCTGGIRCEKASSFLLSQGFQEVYHLKGGILKYLEEIPPEESLWQGECFVFDERIAVKHGLAEGSHTMCHSCGHPLAEEDQASPYYEEGISCPYCYEQLTPQKKARQQERQRQRHKLM
jgi:UPF0176 protein